MDKIKEAFDKVKNEIDYLNFDLNELKKEMSEIVQILQKINENKNLKSLGVSAPEVYGTKYNRIVMKHLNYPSVDEYISRVNGKTRESILDRITRATQIIEKDVLTNGMVYKNAGEKRALFKENLEACILAKKELGECWISKSH